MRPLPPAQWSAATRCAPWNLRELLAHVRIVVGRVPAMAAAPAPPRAVVSAVDYYRPDQRFSASANAERVALARSSAAGPPLEMFQATVREVVSVCRAEPAGRVVLTRHGDAMTLDDFLATRVVEVAVHGLDLADAAGSPAWLTPAAAAVLQDLLLGPGRVAPAPERFIRAATGRGDDPKLLARLRPRRLALG